MKLFLWIAVVLLIFSEMAMSQMKAYDSSSALEFSFEDAVGIKNAKKNKLPLLHNSSEIFKLSEFSVSLDSLILKKFGHKLLETYYQNTSNATQYDYTQTLYLQAALGFEGEKIMSLFQNIADPKNLGIIESIFECEGNNTQGCLKLLWPEQKPTLNLVEFVVSIKDYLNLAISRMQEAGVTADFIKSFSSELRTKYIEPLNIAEQNLSEASVDKKLKFNIDLISQTIRSLSFLPESVIGKILKDLEVANRYSDLLVSTLNAPTYSDNILKLIANIWLDLTPDQRVQYIQASNRVLYDSLNDQSEIFVRWLAGRGDITWSDTGYLEWIAPGTVKDAYKEKLQTSCHAKLYAQLKSYINDEEVVGYNNVLTSEVMANLFQSFTKKELKELIYPSYNEKKAEFLSGYFSSKDKKNKVNSFNSIANLLCLDDVAQMLDTSINKYTFAKLDSEIRNWGSMIEDMVAQKTIESVTGLTGAASSKAAFKEYFQKMAYPIVNDMFFKGQTLPALERTNVALLVNEEDKIKTYTEDSSVFETGAKTLGTSLSAQFYRLKEMEQIENKAPDSLEYTGVVFSQINKMLSMIGFKDFEKEMVPSLHRKFSGNGGELDVYKYDCSPRKLLCQSGMENLNWREDCTGSEDAYKSSYQVPDRLAIQNTIEPVDGIFEYNASVEAQAELIRGISLMVKYFQDWKIEEDGFDQGMGKKNFNGIKIFPKEAFVNLTVGLVTTPIRGLKKPGTGIRLFGNNGIEMSDWLEASLMLDSLKGVNGEDLMLTPQQACHLPPELEEQSKNAMKGVSAVTFSDVKSENGNSIVSDEVKARDLALMIIALDEFLEATEGISETKASVFNPVGRLANEKHNMIALLEGRKLLSKMMYGTFVFLSSKLQAANGGYYSSFNLGTQERSNKQNFVDQMYIIDALLRVHKQWGAQLAATMAWDTYTFMNSELWNKKTSFYNLNTSEAPLLAYAQLLYTLNKLKPLAPESSVRDELNYKYDFYLKEFENWASKALH